MKRTCLRVLAVLTFAAAPASCQGAFPHQQRLAPGVECVGFADRYQSANCGWVETASDTILIDLPRGMAPAEFLAAIKKSTGKPVTALVLTHCAPDDAALVNQLHSEGIQHIYLTRGSFKTLTLGDAKPASDTKPSEGFEVISKKTTIGGPDVSLDIIPFDECRVRGAAAVHLPQSKVLFAGPLVINGPRAPLPSTDTDAWIAALKQLARLRAPQVVPGFGSWGAMDLVDRQRRFLFELRRQVGYFIAQGRPHEDLYGEIRLGPDYLVWMPYDTPLAEDVDHVFQELTVPLAPFGGHPPAVDDAAPHALVLIGDQPHEPGHIEEGLRPVFQAAGVVPHFTVDVRTLSADNLAHVRLLVVLRDGLQRPNPGGKTDYVWMTPEQEKAVVDFVHRGGGFLNLHNSMGLYPEDGPYLKLVGGRYIGHGPLERFRVEVVDRNHAITRGVEDFSVADEQHTPPCDEQKVRVLLRNRSDDGRTAAAGWVYEPGQGRLCHLANGHTRESLLHPMYQRLMRNATLWCLRHDPAD
jgi:glyoxylase-like metal-dependent hydrolase (beta-lactamase superfamily II)/type 1 glutamine amidotransferase